MCTVVYRRQRWFQVIWQTHVTRQTHLLMFFPKDISHWPGMNQEDSLQVTKLRKKHDSVSLKVIFVILWSLFSIEINKSEGQSDCIQNFAEYLLSILKMYKDTFNWNATFLSIFIVIPMNMLGYTILSYLVQLTLRWLVADAGIELLIVLHLLCFARMAEVCTMPNMHLSLTKYFSTII